MNLNKKDVVMIGDNLTKDINGAKTFGIEAVHFKA